MISANFNYTKWNTLLGWVAFFIALVTYSLTVEPSMSFWDCGEYIATAAKLEVGHPPGAPLFQMVGAFFALFALNAKQIALMVNMVSVFSSAFTILFLFWSSTMVLRKIVQRFNNNSNSSELVILGSSFIGALAYTFSDSFWYNAVEAEVYAMASLFISLLFWLGLRWEQDMGTPRGNKWLLVISLIIGLSFGVHFMALLTIPSIGFLYYFKHYKTITLKNFIVANVVVVSILLFIFKLLLPLTMALFAKAEVYMVNEINLPFNSGTIFIALLLVAFFFFGLRFTQQKGMVMYNTLILCVLFILIGFSTWIMLPIRANANTVINENKPSDAAEVLAYYNREQYGANPLFYGPQYTDIFAGLDEEQPYLDKAPNYERDYKTGTYRITNNYKNAEQNSDKQHKAILPRLWSTEHIENYISFSNPPAFRIKPIYSEEKELVDLITQFRQGYATQEFGTDEYIKFLKTYGEYLIIEKPSTFDNLRFLIEYQFGYMYGRYLMWNFAGRQNDIQGKYDNLDGNWLSGISFVDELRLGSQDNLPQDVLNNKGRNTYYFLPLILGVIGMLYHAKRDPKSFYVLLSLFLFMGLALKIYLNERPFEPRERDYALVGSFYVFAMWIGFGVYALYDYLKNCVQPKLAAPLVLGGCLLAAPVLMASQNWDDHNRANKYTAIAMAKAYLDSCEPNAILFTIGDNDTFPLWYAQEIEGIRTDIKIVNTSLFMTDWYIDQMKCKTYKAEGLPISFSHEQYVGDKLDYALFDERTKSRWDIKALLNFIGGNDPRMLREMPNGQKVHFYPTNLVRIPVDTIAYRQNNTDVSKNDSIVPYIDIEIKGQAMYKNRIMMLDVIANNNWKRPVYFTGGSFGDDDYLWMKDFLQLDGMVYKLVPFYSPIPENGSTLDMGKINSDKMYNIVMKWDWGNSESPTIYHDPETRKNSISYRSNLARLMEQLVNENKIDKAKKVIDLAMTKMPVNYFGYYSLLDPFAGGYYAVGEKQKARKLLDQLMTKYKQNLSYYKGLGATEQNDIAIDIITDIERYRALLEVMKDRGDLAYYNQNKATFNTYNSFFKRFDRDNE